MKKEFEFVPQSWKGFPGRSVALSPGSSSWATARKESSTAGGDIPNGVEQPLPCVVFLDMTVWHADLQAGGGRDRRQ